MTGLTVVTPTLNAERYLAECLASVAAQTAPGVDVEHLVVDGGSTDATEKITRGLGVTFVSCRGSNQSRAINEGFRRATGDVVAWLNADDTYVDATLPFVIARFAADPALDALIGDCEVVGPDGQHFWWEKPGPYDFRRLLQRGNYLAQPTVFMRGRTLERVGYVDESLEYGMDYDLWLRLRECPVEYVPRPLARFRWHPDSKSATQQMQAWREALRIVRRHGGGWTPHLARAYARCLITLARTRAITSVTGARPLRPLTRGHDLVEHG